MKKLAGLLLAIATLGVLLPGCAPTSAEPEGYKKEDFAKTDPPPGWGPGGTAGPAGAGPAAPPPGGTTGPANQSTEGN
ncbi:MAG: hypothetical protein LCH41_00860 [Armatimonadetes bacterium]|nr:hypothetical protein [Armatimonadota bacterium]